LEPRLRDRSTAVNTNSIQLFLDNHPVLAIDPESGDQHDHSIRGGSLPALSAHNYKIVFSDNGAPVTTQPNQFRFTVADYLTLPTALGTPLDQRTPRSPGYNVSVYHTGDHCP
jgi:hypothetical protein